MGLFGRKEKTIDLTERYHRQKERIDNLKESMKQNAATSSQTPTQNSFGFLREMASSSAQSSDFRQ